MQYGVILRRIHSVWPPCFLLASFIPPPSHSSSSCAFCVATSPFAGQLCRNCLSCASPPLQHPVDSCFHSFTFLSLRLQSFVHFRESRTDKRRRTDTVEAFSATFISLPVRYSLARHKI